MILKHFNKYPDDFPFQKIKGIDFEPSFLLEDKAVDLCAYKSGSDSLEVPF